MRCATCGTENEPNSRFCGGCGAKQPASGEQRLAPTAKISDDAQYPQPAARPAVMPQGPVSYAPPSIPPQSVSSPPPVLATPPPGSIVRPASQNPASSPPVSRVTPRPTPKPQMSNLSESMPVPARRPIGLMIALLLVDIGLAAAGGVLLSKGLAEREAKKTEPAPVERKTEAPIAAPAPADKVAASLPAAAAAPTPPPAPAIAAAREAPKQNPAPDAKLADKRPESTKVVDAKATDKKPQSTKVVDPKLADKKPDSTKVVDTKPVETKPDGAKVVPTEPQDPYVAPNTEREIDAAAAASKASFGKCAADHSAHGSIKIAFQVRADGRVANAAAVENTTGSTDLARCLIAEISSWKVSAHNGAAINMLRPFTYP